MNSVMFASFRQYGGRLIATGIAIVLAVGFVVTGLVITNSYSHGLGKAVAAELEHADIKILEEPGSGLKPQEAVKAFRENSRQLQSLPEVEQVATRELVFATVRANGKTTNEQVEPLLAEGLRWQILDDGRWPQSDQEVVLDARSAKSLKLGLGSEVAITNMDGEPSPPTTFTIVGLYTQPAIQLSGDAPGLLATQEGFDRLTAHPFSNGVLVKAKEGVTPEALKAVITSHLSKELIASTREELIQDRLEALSGGTIITQAFVMGFGVISLLVAGFVIANTFRLLVAQRTKELALLRCVGTTKRQIRRMILTEGAFVGLIFSTLGAIVGIGVAHLIAWLTTTYSTDFIIQDIVVDPISVVACIGLGILTTMVFAFGPARQATRVFPLEALRPLTRVEERTSSWIVTGIGGVLAGVGSIAMVFFAHQDAFLAALGSGAISAIGMLLIARVVLPPVIHLAGRGVAFLGPTQELAVANTTRNRHRTAATGTALLVGTVLVTLLTTGVISTRESILNKIDDARPIDLVVEQADASALTPATLSAIEHHDQVQAISVLEEGSIAMTGTPKAGNKPIMIQGINPNTLTPALHALKPIPGANELGVQKRNTWGLQEGQTVTISGDAGTRELKVMYTVFTTSERVLVDQETLHTLVTKPATTSAIIRLVDGVSPSETLDVINDLKTIGNGLAVHGPGVERASYTQALNAILLVLLGLLGVSIVIAIVGIGNTAALSVLERRHETAMLRAIGLTRAQLISLITTEAVLAAVVSALVGVGLGVFYAWAGVTAIGSSVPDLGMALHIPWFYLSMIVLGTFIAGLMASILPALGASKRPIILDLANE